MIGNDFQFFSEKKKKKERKRREQKIGLESNWEKCTNNLLKCTYRIVPQKFSRQYNSQPTASSASRSAGNYPLIHSFTHSLSSLHPDIH